MEIKLENNIEVLQMALLNEKKVKLACIFGSYGTSKQKESSDVDLAISIGHPMAIDQKLYFSNLIQKLTGKEVDLIDLTVATGTVFKEALTTGRIIVNKDPNHLGQILIRMLSEENDYQLQKRKLANQARERIFSVQGSSKSKT
jgi:predicted nucleotidyltransferase